jgi:hypothetical protein
MRTLHAMRARLAEGSPVPDLDAAIDQIESRATRFLRAARQRARGFAHEAAIAREIRAKLQAALALRGPLPCVLGEPMDREAPSPEAVPPAAAPAAPGTPGQAASRDGAAPPEPDRAAAAPPDQEGLLAWGTLLAWLFVHPLGRLTTAGDPERRSREWLQTWTLDRALMGMFQELGAEPWRAARRVELVEALVVHAPGFAASALRPDGAWRTVEAWMADDRLRSLLRVNEYEDTWWFEKESFEELVAWLVTVVEVEWAVDRTLTAPQRAARLNACRDLAKRLLANASESGYRLERWVALARS